MRIMFMGTPEFAKECLRAIYESGEEIVGVVTTPDKPTGRGMVLTPSAVKKYAIAVGLPVYQPATLKDGAFIDTLEELNPELIIVVAYGRILPPYVLGFPKHGCINAHASILPKYRGAAPIQRAIIDGENETGVSIMRMDVGLDTGDVMLVERVPILENDNYEIVQHRLVYAGCYGLLKAIELFKSGKESFIPQGAEFTYAEKITKADYLIDFAKTAREVHNKIRGLSPRPLAFTKTPDGKVLKIAKAYPYEREVDGEAGTVVCFDGGIVVKCGNGAIVLDEIVPEGKGRMSASAYINGRKIKVGDILGRA